MRAETESLIEGSRPSIRSSLRASLDEQADYDMVGTRQSYEWGE